MDKSAFVRLHSRSPRIYPSSQTVYLQGVTVKLHLGNVEKCTTDYSDYHRLIIRWLVVYVCGHYLHKGNV